MPFHCTVTDFTDLYTIKCKFSRFSRTSTLVRLICVLLRENLEKPRLISVLLREILEKLRLISVLLRENLEKLTNNIKVLSRKTKTESEEQRNQILLLLYITQID